MFGGQLQPYNLNTVFLTTLEDKLVGEKKERKICLKAAFAGESQTLKVISLLKIPKQNRGKPLFFMM